MDDYIKSLLTQTLEAHTILNELKGQPADLGIIKRHVGKRLERQNMLKRNHTIFML